MLLSLVPAGCFDIQDAIIVDIIIIAVIIVCWWLIGSSGWGSWRMCSTGDQLT